MKKSTLYLSDMPADVALNAGEHNHMKLLALVPKEYMKPGVYVATIEHDDPCAIFKKGNCNCRPNITIKHTVYKNTVFRIRWK